MDDRGQSVAIGVGLATVFGLGVLYLLLDEAWVPLHDECNELVTNATAQTTCSWLGTTWEWYLVLALAVTIIGTIATAAFQRQGGL